MHRSLLTRTWPPKSSSLRTASGAPGGQFRRAGLTQQIQTTSAHAGSLALRKANSGATMPTATLTRPRQHIGRSASILLLSGAPTNQQVADWTGRSSL